MSFAQRSPKITQPAAVETTEDTAAHSEVIGELFNTGKVNFSDFAAVLGDLRKAGEKTNPHAIHQGLRELSSPEGRQARQQRNSVNEGKIVRIPGKPGLHDPNAEALALRVETYESQLEEAQRELEQSRHLRDDVANLQRQLERARKREEELKARLRSTEEKVHENASLEEELHRQKTQLQRVQQKEETLRIELKRLREAEPTISEPAESAPVEPLSNVIALNVPPAISERELQLSNELEVALAALDRAEAETREIADLRRLLTEEQNLRQALEARWLSTQERAEQAKVLEQELAQLKATFGELLQSEQTLHAQYDALSEQTAYLDGIAAEVRVLESQLVEARACEKGLTEQLEEATRKAILAEELEDQVANLQSILDEFRQREVEWSTRQEQERQQESVVADLRMRLEDASRALTETQARETHYAFQLTQTRHQLGESVSVSQMQVLEAELSTQSQALLQTKNELLEKTSEVEEIWAQLARAETAVATLREREAALVSAQNRESDLVSRLDEASRRAIHAERELAQHTEMMEWGRERTMHIQQQLLEARSALAKLYPEAAEVEEIQASNTAAESSYAASFGTLETLLGQLHRELEQAQQYKSFLLEELGKAQTVVTPAPETRAGITVESVELRKCLAETIEIELSRQNSALDELTRREELLRAQLGKIKPTTLQAQSIQGQLSSQEAYREDLKRRELALTQLLRETLTSLRTGRA